jgi:hypothetical protein
MFIGAFYLGNIVGALMSRYSFFDPHRGILGIRAGKKYFKP